MSHQYFIHPTKSAIDVLYPDGRCATHIRPCGGKSKVLTNLLAGYYPDQPSEVNMTTAISPYQEALKWIRLNPGTGSATSLAKLILSLYNSDCGFAFSECVGNLDQDLTELAVRMAGHYAKYGENDELRSVGFEIAERYDRLWLSGEAMAKARQKLHAQWEKEKATS